jgi:hypothetical protein
MKQYQHSTHARELVHSDLKPSEFRKLPKQEQDRIFQEEANSAADMYLANPELIIE